MNGISILIIMQYNAEILTIFLFICQHLPVGDIF